MEDQSQEKAFCDSLDIRELYRLTESREKPYELLSKYKAYLIEQGELHKVKMISFKFDNSDEFIELRKKKIIEAQSYAWDWMHSVGFTLDCCSGLDFEDTFALMSDYKDASISALESENARLRKTLEKVRSMSCNASPEQNRKIRFLITETLKPNSKEE